MPQPIPHRWTSERLRDISRPAPGLPGRGWEDWLAMLNDPAQSQNAQQALFRAIQMAEAPQMSVALRDALSNRVRRDFGAWNLYNERYGYGAEPLTDTANFADWLSSMMVGGGAAARPTIMRDLGQWATGERITDEPERERASRWRDAQERNAYGAMEILAEAFGMSPVVRMSQMQQAPDLFAEYRRGERGTGTDYYRWLTQRMRGGRG